MKCPFKRPVAIVNMSEPGHQAIVADDSELVLSTYDATLQELDWIARAINTAPEDL